MGYFLNILLASVLDKKSYNKEFIHQRPENMQFIFQLIKNGTR